MHLSWKRALREGIVTGSIASVFSAASLAWAGGRRSEPAAPLNAVSHWFFGARALHRDAPSLRFTATGYAIHHVASMFWGVLHARCWGLRRGHKDAVPAALGAIGTSAAACFVDFQLTPTRLTPGFEHRLSRPELAVVYACFGAGLFLGSLLLRPGPPPARG